MLFTAVLCLPLVALLPRFQISSEARVLLEGDQRNLTSYEKVKRILANVEVAVISLECANVFSLEGIDAVRRVSDAFQKLPGVQDVKSLTHSVKPVRQGLRFEMVPLVPAGLTQPEQLEEFKRFCLDNPLIRDVMVAADGKHTLLTVTFREKFGTVESQERLDAQIQATLAPFRREGLRFQTLAMPLIEGEIRATLRSDVKRFLPASIGLLLLTLGWTFRSGRILLLVLINQAFVLLLLPGLLKLSGLALSVFTVMLFPLLSGIHLAQLAHVYSVFQTAQLAGHTTDEALQIMLREVFKPCLFSLVTTAIGLMSLALSEVVQIREFGMLGTLGVCLVFLMTFGPGLALMKLVFTRRPLCPPAPVETSAGPAQDGATPVWIAWMTGVVRNHGILMIIIVAALSLLSVLGLTRLRTDIRAVEFLNQHSVTRQAVEELDKVYGGINVVQLEVDSGATNGINGVDFLRYVERVQRFAEEQLGVSATYSYAQLLAMINQIWEGGRADALRLPENPLLINLFVAALKSQSYPFLTALCDDSFRTAYLVVRTPDMPSDRYLAIIDKILRHAQQTKPAQVTVSAAAGIHSILEADRRILRSQMNTFGGSTVVIGLVLTLLWRSPWLALLSLTTNAVPVALVLAFAGFAGVPLNSINIMVAAICLGIMVDDSIHFITHWRDECRQGLSAGDAMTAAFRVKGRPMVFTSWILIAIFSIFWFSSFPPVVQFGGLSAIAFACALATVLFFLPSVLCVFRSRADVTRSDNRQQPPAKPGESL